MVGWGISEGCIVVLPPAEQEMTYSRSSHAAACGKLVQEVNAAHSVVWIIFTYNLQFTIAGKLWNNIQVYCFSTSWTIWKVFVYETKQLEAMF